MSLKENVGYIKDEISSQEKFFEGFFKLEKFYKKYKLVIITSIIVIVGYITFTLVNNYTNEQNTIEANIAYSNVLKNPKDQKSIDILKEKNNQLLDIAMYQTSSDKTKANNIEFIKEITQFNKAIQSNDIKALDSLIINPNFVLKEYALFNKALILTQNKEYEKAKKSLALITPNSSVESLVVMLKHYLLTK